MEKEGFTLRFSKGNNMKRVFFNICNLKFKISSVLLLFQVLFLLMEMGNGNNRNEGEHNNVYKTQASYLHAGSLFLSENKNWQEFQAEHIFNPDEHPDYGNWRGKEWRRWMFKTRAPKKSLERENEVDERHFRNWNPHEQHRRRHGPGNSKLQGILASMKHMEVVVIARPHDVLASFTGNLAHYGTKNQAMVWSQWSFPTLIFQKAGRRLRIFDCGEMFIAGRLLNGYPTYLHDFYPAIIRNPLGGHLRYPVNRRCNKIPSV